MVERILEGKGIFGVHLKKRHFRDKAQIVFSSNEDIEIDGLSDDPPIIIEITAILRDIDKINVFLKKKKFVENNFDLKFRGFFVASGTERTRDQLAEVNILLRKNQSELLNL
ncbi:MAG: hypothetical protein EU549_00235 [Promethearchaeota archaeon]|nr:MAG: hypothetical protein EU549_00235 [Candidatus Lokiarchaeota archaeon]